MWLIDFAWLVLDRLQWHTSLLAKLPSSFHFFQFDLNAQFFDYSIRGRRLPDQVLLEDLEAAAVVGGILQASLRQLTRREDVSRLSGIDISNLLRPGFDEFFFDSGTFDRVDFLHGRPVNNVRRVVALFGCCPAACYTGGGGSVR